MSNLPGFGKTNTTVLTALALTIGFVLYLGPTTIATGNVFDDSFIGPLFGGGNCKDTGWEVDVQLHSIGIGNNKEVPYTEGEWANCGGGDEFDFDTELKQIADTCVEPIAGQDYCLSDNRHWHQDLAGYPNLVVSFANLHSAYADCSEKRDESKPLETRTIERGGVEYKYDYHIFCFDVRVKTDADGPVQGRYTTWQYMAANSCNVINPETGKQTMLESKAVDFIVHETSFRFGDLCVNKTPNIAFDDQGIYGNRYQRAVGYNTAPPCVLIGYTSGLKSTFPSCEGKRFDGNLFVRFDVDECALVACGLDDNADADKGYSIGIMGVYLNGKEQGKEGGSAVADPENGKFISDFEAESDLEAAIAEGGTRLNVLTLGKSRIGNSMLCPSFKTCDANFDGKGAGSYQTVLIDLPVELLPAMYYEVNCTEGLLTVDKCHIQNYETVNGYVDFTVRVDVISTGGFDPQVGEGEGEQDDPEKGEDERDDAVFGYEDLVDWLEDNAVLAIAIWFIFVISLVVVKFLVRTSPVQVIR